MYSKNQMHTNAYMMSNIKVGLKIKFKDFKKKRKK